MNRLIAVIFIIFFLLICSTVQAQANPTNYLTYKSEVGTVKVVPSASKEKRHTLFATREEGTPRRAFIIDNFANVIQYWKAHSTERWYLTKLYGNTLFSLQSDFGLVLMNPKSEVMKVHGGKFHHDFFVKKRKVYILTRETIEKFINNRKVYISNANVERINLNDSSREVLLSISDFFLNDVPTDRMQQAMKLTSVILKRKGDPFKEANDKSVANVFHTNALKLITYDVGKLAKKGDLLINIPNISKTIVFRPITKQIISEFKYNFPHVLTHDPTLLPNGNLLYFVNRFEDKSISKVVEFDPVKQEIVWEFPKEDKQLFYTGGRGRVQLLKNGSMLITSSNQGLALEVDRSGRVIWRFQYNNRDEQEEERGVGFFIRLDNTYI